MLFSLYCIDKPDLAQPERICLISLPRCTGSEAPALTPETRLSCAVSCACLTALGITVCGVSAGVHATAPPSGKGFLSFLI